MKTFTSIILSIVLSFCCLSNTWAIDNTFDGMFDLYQDNRSRQISNYITEDFILLSYAMIQKQSLNRLEETIVMPAFRDLIAGLGHHVGKTEKDYDVANQDYVAVLAALISGQGSVTKAGNTERANEELSLILASEGIRTSPLWGLQIDYTQFKPRGAYTGTQERQSYFRTLKYASSVLFAVKESKSTGVTARNADRMVMQAKALVSAIQADSGLTSAYDQINATFSWQFGRADDLTLSDLALIFKKDGKKNSAQQWRHEIFKYAQNNARQPKIISGIVDKTKLEKGVSVQDAMTGWRLIPQRYTADAAVFQTLIFENVTDYLGKADPFGLAMIDNKAVKGFPSAYELMALLGSRAAENKLKASDATNFKGYRKAEEEARQMLANAQGLSGLQLGLMNLWLTSEGDNCPDERRRLTSALSLWTWQKYISVLYVKQPTTVVGKNISINKPRDTAWLEPSAALYLALHYIVEQHARVSQDPIWDQFSAILEQCISIAYKERNQGKLDESGRNFLNSLDKALLALTGGKDHPIVIDVHTEPDSRMVVEEGIGFPEAVWEKSCRGALFTHREFKYPMDSRLTDNEWKEILEK